MAGEQPPDKARDRRNPRENDKSDEESWREKYYGALGASPPRRKPPAEPDKGQTWRPNVDSSGQPEKPRHSSQDNRRPAPYVPPPAQPRDNGNGRNNRAGQGNNGSNNAGAGRDHARQPDARPNLPPAPPSDRNRGSRPSNSNPQSPTPKPGQTYRPLPPSGPQRNQGNGAPVPPRHGGPGAEDKYELSLARPANGQVKARPVPRRRKGMLRSILLYGGISALVLGIIAVLFLVTRITSFVSGISVQRVDQNGAPVNNSSLGGRVNILLMGLDVRPNDQGDGTRSDTMIVVSVDQASKSASMLSIPRDLWVDIPGHGSQRINTAYFFGEQDKPGAGGPPLAKTTVSKLLGIPIDYFVQVDFNGFRQIVDAIGGVTLDVKKPLIDSEYPTEDFGVKRLYIPAGVQRMDGKTALEYARSRHADSDLGRNQRQQAVLLAIREQGINLGAITNTELQSALQGAIKTDLQLGDILSLVQTGLGLNKDNIHSYSIDANLTRQANVAGNDVLIPDVEGIRNLVRQLTSAPTAPAKETANISVLNGTFVQGRASRTQQFLEGKGYTITNIEQASDAGNYPRTVIRVYNGKQKTASELAGLLGVANTQIQVKNSGAPPGIDIEIVCGEDLKLPE